MSLLQPRRTKFRKQQKLKQGKILGMAQRGNKVDFGDFGLKAAAGARITGRQIEAARRAMTRFTKRGGKIYIRIFPDKPISKKPLEVRQGKGKGSVEYWVAIVKPGTVMFEIEGVSRDVAKEAFRLAAAKLPIKTIFCERTVM